MKSYRYSNNWAGLLFVVENTSKQPVHYKLDFNVCRNLVSSRGALMTCDTIPPKHRYKVNTMSESGSYIVFFSYFGRA